MSLIGKSRYDAGQLFSYSSKGGGVTASPKPIHICKAFSRFFMQHCDHINIPLEFMVIIGIPSEKYRQWFAKKRIFFRRGTNILSILITLGVFK